MGLPIVVQAVVVVLVVAIMVLAWVLVRHRLLVGRPGAFDCSLRLPHAAPGGGWVLGVARYSGEYLEWYAAFDVWLRPRLQLERAWTVAVDQRPPSPIEEVALYNQGSIVVLEQRRTSRDPHELAMSTDSLTGLLSWLEAAPPGLGRYGNVDTTPTA